jgi:hypothetical protein
VKDTQSNLFHLVDSIEDVVYDDEPRSNEWPRAEKALILASDSHPKPTYMVVRVSDVLDILRWEKQL